MKEYTLNAVENIWAKGKIAHHATSFFPMLSAAEASESICMWERVNVLSQNCTNTGSSKFLFLLHCFF